MGDTYRFPVALKWDEGPDSLRKVRNKLLLHFQSKNKSNGGECQIRELDCSRGYIVIHFRDESVRNQVLQKKPQELKLPDGKVIALDVRPLPETTAPATPASAPVCKVEEQQTDPVTVEPSHDEMMTDGGSPHVLVENVPDSCTPDILTLLVENISDRNVDKDFYVEQIPERSSAVITFTCNIDLPDFIGKVSHHHRAKQYNLTVRPLEDTRVIRAEGFSPTTSEDIITLYFESSRNGGGPIEKVEVTPDLGEALITFTRKEDVKSVLTKQHELNKKAISVYPYFPAIGECLYGKKRPVVKSPDPVDFPLHPHLLDFFSINAKIKQAIEDHLADHHCEVQWPAPDCHKPVVTLSVPSKLSAEYRKMAKIAPTWSKNVQSEMSHLMSLYTVTACDVKTSVWEAIKEEVSSPTYKGIVFKPDLAAEKVVLVGLTEDLAKTEASFRGLVDKTTTEMMRVEDEVSIEPDIYNLLGLDQVLQKDSSDLTAKYDSTTRKVKLYGTKDDVQNVKSKIVNVMQGLKIRAVHQDPQIIQFLLATDNEELSSALFTRNNITAMMQVREKDVLLTASSEKDLAAAEQQMKKELACRQIPIEDRNVLQIPEWDSFRTTMSQMLNADKMAALMEAIPPGAESQVVISGLSFAVEIAHQQIHEFLMENTMVQEDVVVKSGAVMKFIENNTKIFDAMKDKVNVKVKNNTVCLSGPKQYVKEAETSLRTVLSNLHSTTLYIDKPGAKKLCLENEDLQANNVRTMFRCEIHLQKDGDAAALGMPLTEPQCQVTLPGGVIIAVHKDNPYRQKVGVAVIAASDDLKPIGGMVQTLLNEDVRSECEAIVQKEGKLAPGDSTITDAGNLPCKQLIHAVSPKWDGKTSSRCERLLRKAIKSGLDLAAEKGHSSVAISASSFTACGYPVDTCTEIIVTSIKQHIDSQQGGSSIRYIHLIDTEDNIVTAFTRFLREEYGEQNAEFSSKKEKKKQKAEKKKEAVTKPSGQMVTTKEGIKINVMEGNIQDATTNVIVNSVGKDLDLRSGAVSSAIFKKAGPKLQDLIMKEKPQTPVGDGCVLVTGGCNLQSDLVIHCVVPQWDKGQGSSEKILRKIINDCLRAAEERQMRSICFPAMGTGILQFPKTMVAAIMYEESINFSSEGKHQHLREVTFMLHPSDTQTIKAFSTELERRIKDPASQKKPDKSHSLFGPVTSPSSEVHEMTIGSITYQVKKGDITKEDTDVIVNSTNKTFNFKSGVSKAILEGAGQGVEDECAQLAKAQPTPGLVVTSAGNLPCKNIIHIADIQNVKKSVTDALTECERLQASSVAFPALGTGNAKLSADVVADVILAAAADFVSSKSAKSVQMVRVVVFDPAMLQDFSASMMKKQHKPGFFTRLYHQIFGSTNDNEEEEETKAFELRENIEPAIYHLCAESKKSVSDASSWLQDLILKQQQENIITDDWVLEFDEKDRENLVELQKTSQVTVNIDLPSTTIKVSGLPKDVLTMTNQIQDMIKKVREKKTKEREAELCSNLVEWRYHDGNKMVPFDRMTNLELETANNENTQGLNIDVSGVTYTVCVEVKRMRDPRGNEKEIQRFDKHEAALDLPPYWDSMEQSQMKVVAVSASSPEYSDVHAQFAKSCQMKVLKIERIQNLYLYKNYQVKKQSLETKNRRTDNERQLFHGTDENTVKSVNSNGFNRSYSGLNVGAVLGNGTYFALDANYSAHDGFSKPDPNGHKYMYLARVLTGEFCAGQKGMLAPLAKNPSNTTDLYDSVTDNVANPSIFAIFNDVQAYPEYLITFSK